MDYLEFVTLRHSDDTLAHKNGFKYIKRTWKNGKWNYVYKDKQTLADNEKRYTLANQVATAKKRAAEVPGNTARALAGLQRKAYAEQAQKKSDKDRADWLLDRSKDRFAEAQTKRDAAVNSVGYAKDSHSPYAIMVTEPKLKKAEKAVTVAANDLNAKKKTAAETSKAYETAISNSLARASKQASEISERTTAKAESTVKQLEANKKIYDQKAADVASEVERAKSMEYNSLPVTAKRVTAVATQAVSKAASKAANVAVSAIKESVSSIKDTLSSIFAKKKK